MQTGGNQLLDAKHLLKDVLDLQIGMTYADLGMGSAAHFVFPAAGIVGPDGKVYGLDILKGVLEAAKSRAQSEGRENMEFVWTDLEVYGAAKAVESDSVDRISMINVLYQTKDDTHVFNEANRMLKSGGKCLVIDWNPGGSFGPPEEERTSLDKVRQMAKVVKWNEIEALEASDYHFAILFQK